MLRRIPGSICWKTHGSRYSARHPDIYFTCAALQGRGVWIELKRPGGKPTKLQAYRLERLARAGCLAFCATSPEEVKRQLIAAGIPASYLHP